MIYALSLPHHHNTSRVNAHTILKFLFFFFLSSYLLNTMSHSFIESNFSRLTYCDHCQGLLWGLVKQGCRCTGTVFSYFSFYFSTYKVLYCFNPFISKVVEQSVINSVKRVYLPVPTKNQSPRYIKDP